MQLSRLFPLFFLLAGLYGNCPVFAQATDPAELLEETADEVIETVVRLRGLELKAPVPKGVKSRAEIAEYLDEQLSKEYSRDELQKEGRMLIKLGLIPDGFNYEEYFLKLLAEQVAGYYDQEKKIFFIASWLSAEAQRPIMAHELTHALQDQHFDIEKMLDDAREWQNVDQVLALQALLEGDALVVMLQYDLEPYKRHFSELPDLAFVMQTQMATMQAQYAVFRDAPAFIQQSLVFPYGYGASFIQKAWKENPDWQSINKIYSDLPVSTEQVLHPEKYFGVRDNPVPVKPIDTIARLGSDWKIVYQNVMGEFSLGLLLNLHLTEEHSQKSVSGWGGDQVIYLENGAGRDAAIVNTIWDTEEDAEKFFLAMNTWFSKRFPNVDKKSQTAMSFSLIKDGEFYEMRRDGRNLYLLIGLNEEDSRRWAGN